MIVNEMYKTLLKLQWIFAQLSEYFSFYKEKQNCGEWIIKLYWKKKDFF